ncbi:MAG: hypothetical protein LBQ15_10245 [Clostridium sp.]|nr:hypothetical protein [Clostridium sp.]
MDKYEYKVRTEEIGALIDKGEYAQAVEIADVIDWRRVKSVMMLCRISDLYKINRRYEEAKELLELAYDRHPGGRTIVYSLCELSIKLGEFVQAIEYYKIFSQIAPRDSGRYVLQYKLYEAQEVNLEERIEVLEELKERDYREKWAYELAYLYHRVGLGTRCVEECDELILWFGEGKYVIKAMELKMLHQPLSPEQQEKYTSRLGTEPAAAIGMTVAADMGADASADGETGSYQDAHTDRDTDRYTGRDRTARAAIEMSGSVAATNRMALDRRMDTDAGRDTDMDTDIQVKTMDVENPYNTMNIQKALAAGIKEIQIQRKEETTSAVQESAGLQKPDTDSLDGLQLEAVDENLLEAEEIPVSEVFFGETGEVGTVTEKTRPFEPIALKMRELKPDTAQLVMNQLRQEHTQEPESGPPEEIADILSMESDGQLRIVLPEAQRAEKQITGQLGIEDILAEWERMKRDNEEKRKEAVRQRVLRQTGAMFTEFEASIKDEIRGNPPVEEDLSMEEDFVYEKAPTAGGLGQEAAAGAERSPEESIEERISAEALPSEGRSEEERLEAVSGEDPKAAEEEQGEVFPRSLTKEEKELYAPYIQSKSARERLVTAIDNISMAAYTGNLLVTGEEGMNTLTLAKNMIQEAQRNDSSFSGKVATVSGASLNKQEVSSILKHFENGALMIRQASGMNRKTAESLAKSLEQESISIIVAMEDTKKAADRLLEEYPQLETCFTARMDVEALSNDVLVKFGRKYARENEFSIDEMGILALHTLIEERQTSEHVVTVMEVKEIVDEAIARVNRKTVGHFVDILLAKRYDEEDMVILREKDFIPGRR